MKIIGTSEAAYLLGISCQRVRKLLSQGRIKGAYKKDRFWKIPLYGQLPKVIPGSRGPKGFWYLKPRQTSTKIHINKPQINKNYSLPPNERKPVIKVIQGKREEYGFQIEVTGPSRIVYQPDRPLAGCKSVVLWIDTYSPVKFIDMNFQPNTARQSKSRLSNSKHFIE